MQEKGTNWFTRYILRCLGTSKCDELNLFTEDILKQDYHNFTSEDEVYEHLSEMVFNYIEGLSVNELASLRYYTGYDFRNINNTMRCKWNYEENGLLTNEKKDKYQKLGEEISNIINRFPEISFNMKAYRGVSIRAFYDYGITSLSELSNMVGHYIYESGFTSSSLLRNHSFFAKQPEWGDRCNIEIEYYIPANSHDGAILLSDALSYSKGQIEYVMNSGSLSKIISVEIDKENDTARLQAVLIPKTLWDPKEPEQERTLKK